MSTPKPSPRQLWLGGLLIIFIAISAIVVTLHGLTLNLINAKKMAIFVIFHSRKGRSSVQALMLIVPSGQSHYLFPFKFGISTGGLSIILCLSICNYMIYQHYQSWVPRALVGHSFSPRAFRIAPHTLIPFFLFINSGVCFAALIAIYHNHSRSSHFDVAQWLDSIPSNNVSETINVNNGESYDFETWACALAAFKGPNPNHSAFVETCHGLQQARFIMIPYCFTSLLLALITLWAFVNTDRPGRAIPKVVVHEIDDDCELDSDGENIELMGGFRDPYEPSHVSHGRQSYSEGLQNDTTVDHERVGEEVEERFFYYPHDPERTKETY